MLSGHTIAVTRAEQQLGEARRLFEQAGAQVLDLPALVIGPPDSWGPLDDALDDLEDFHWLVVSSSNGVEAVEQRLNLRGSGLARRPRGLKIAAVGRKTAARLEELGAFSSGKTVQHTAHLLEGEFGPEWRSRLEGVALVSIGPQTSRTCRELLGRVDAEADPHDLDGLVAACTQALREPR